MVRQHERCVLPVLFVATTFCHNTRHITLLSFSKTPRPGIHSRMTGLAAVPLSDEAQDDHDRR